MSILQGNSCSITQKSGEIWTVQTDLQQICPKSDRLLVCVGILYIECEIIEIITFMAACSRYLIIVIFVSSG